MTLGKLGNIYFGEIPSCTNWLSVGVSLRYRKSARKPSSDINMVVGAKRDVPFEIAAAVNDATWLSAGFERLYTNVRRTKKNPVINMYIKILRHRLDRFACTRC